MLRSPFFYFLVFTFFLSCKEEAKKPIDNELIQKEALNFRQTGIKSYESKDYNTAFYNFNKSKVAFESIKDSANIVFNLIQMASVQQINGDYYGSKGTLTEALPYVKNKNIYSASINNFFGIADKELSLYQDAIFYYKEAIKDCTDEISKQSPLNNIAVVYIEQKEYDKAIHILESILDKKIIDEDPASKARITDNLGFAYFKKGWREKGLLLMQRSLESKNKIDDPYGYIESNLHLSEYYLKTDIEKSIQHAQHAYDIATKFNSIDERLKALSFLIYNDSEIKNKEYAQKYIFLNDSIIKVRNNFKNKFAKIKYDSKKEKDENQKLRLEKAENLLSLQEAKYQKIVAGIGILFLVIVIIILIRYYSNKSRIDKIKTAYDTETRIAKDIHDELANDVFNAITFTQTQPLESKDKKDTLIQKLDHIYTRVRGISRENNNIDTGTNYSDNLKETLYTYNSDSRNILISNIEKVNWDDFDETKKVTIYRVLQELMVNMKKHSHASVVVVKFNNIQKNICIDYTDNGKGCDKNKIIKNGLQNMENRIHAIKGTIIFDTEPDKGFKVKIILPK
ncbi:ATP-binding protein [Flavobacterium sp. W22_SRS_FK3]|uniref:tetratricopeptide repeat-containing sensor histidine kinase n=1 Tax=Flavobacterium sp. W22_SRS_FK3 TaxID=3240275 RepID=UPI003F91D32B